MKKTFWIVVVVILLSFYYWLYQFAFRSKCDCLTETETLKKQNIELLKENNRLDQRVEKFQNESDSLLRVAEQKHQTLVTMKERQNEKMQAIDHLNGNELFDFFASFKTDSTSR